jgi:NAD(P)H dehydrogenase (quinone)
MTKVLIVYTSSFGNTKRMAEAVTEGARSVEGTEVICKEASEATADDVRVADAIVMGSPVRHRTNFHESSNGGTCKFLVGWHGANDSNHHV